MLSCKRLYTENNFKHVFISLSKNDLNLPQGGKKLFIKYFYVGIMM